MKIAHVAHIRLPTEKAHGYQIMRVLSELAKLGHTVTLYVPRRKNAIQDDPFSYYGIEKNFNVEYVPCFDAIGTLNFLGPLAFWISMRSFLRNLSIPREALVYTRDADIVAFLGKKGYRCIYNAHNWNPKRISRVRYAEGVVCNTKGTEEALKKSLILPTVVAYNASDPNPYTGSNKEVLREELSLPTSAPIALYAGHLYGWKGAGVLLEAARLLPNVFFAIVGGSEEDRAKIALESPPNLALLGHKPKAEVPKYLAAADVLLLPNTTATEESVRYTSPIKMFEYMAAGRPIVASDLPSIREVLSPDIALFVVPGDSTALKKGVEETFAHPAEAKQRGENALQKSKMHTWGAHANVVADFLARV